MTIELQLKPATDPPNDARLVIFFVSNVDGRGVTKSYFGYYDKSKGWRYINMAQAQNVTYYAERPEPFDDIKP